MKKIILAGLIGTLSLSASAADTLLNGGFESNNVSLGQQLYAPNAVAASWEFLNGAGIQSNGGPMGSFTSAGNYFGFLQSHPLFSGQASVLSQQFDLSTTANLSFDFSLAQRSAFYNGGHQTVAVALDGLQLGEFTATGFESWSDFNVAALNVAAGTHTLSFTGTNVNAGDSVAYLDGVSMSVTAVPEPSSLVMLLAGLGMVGGVARRRMSRPS